MKKNTCISPASLRSGKDGFTLTAKGYVPTATVAAAMKAERDSLRKLKGDA